LYEYEITCIVDELDKDLYKNQKKEEKISEISNTVYHKIEHFVSAQDLELPKPIITISDNEPCIRTRYEAKK
jgi:hypothetical protein